MLVVVLVLARVLVLLLALVLVLVLVAVLVVLAVLVLVVVVVVVVAPALYQTVIIVNSTGVFTIGPLGPCPPWAVNQKCSKLKVSHTAVIAARVVKQRRQRDSV